MCRGGRVNRPGREGRRIRGEVDKTGKKKKQRREETELSDERATRIKTTDQQENDYENEAKGTGG